MGNYPKLIFALLCGGRACQLIMKLWFSIHQRHGLAGVRCQTKTTTTQNDAISTQYATHVCALLCLKIVTRLLCEEFEISIICMGASHSFPLPHAYHHYHITLCAPGVRYFNSAWIAVNFNMTTWNNVTPAATQDFSS